MSPPKCTVLVAGGAAPSLVNFRGPLLRALRSAGHRVVATAAEDDPEVRTVLATWGVEFYPVPLSRAGFNPWSDLRYQRDLRRLFAEVRPDAVLAYTHKPVIHAALAARRVAARARVFGLITGLGFAFTQGGGLKKVVAGVVLRSLYRCASGGLAGVFFQNPDDQALFRQLGLVRAGTPQCVVRGSGIDLARFPHVPLPRREAPWAEDGGRMPDVGRQPPVISFLLIARLLGDKGIREYAAAARQIRATWPEAEFHLVGPADPNPAAVRPAEVEAWQREGVLRYHGAQGDIRPSLRGCTVYVLPSYREGTPRTVLEAMATGRAVITTDAPGCRETIFAAKAADQDGVREGENGFLVPVKSVGALVAALKRCIREPELAERMGCAGRRLAEEHYDVDQVNRQMLAFMGLGAPT